MWILGEAYRNVVSGTTRAVLNAAVWAVTVGCLALVDVVSVDLLLRQAAAFNEAGAAVHVITTPHLVDGRACESLGQVPGVAVAGALSLRREPLTLTVLPRGSVAAYDVTQEIVAAFTRLDDAGGQGVLLSSDLAQSLGVGADDTVVTTAGATRVRGVYDWPDDGRRRGFAYAMLLPQAASGVFDECWLAGWPAITNASTLLRSALIPYSSAEASTIQVTQLNTSLGLSFDGEERFRGRATRWAGLGAAILGTALGLLAIRLRRLELAAARHAGTSALAQLGQLLLETAWWLLMAAAMAGLGLLLAVSLSSGLAAGYLLGLGSSIMAAACLGTLVGTTIGVWSIRESHLFRYFKTRS
jgi:hypothetical protein